MYILNPIMFINYKASLKMFGSVDFNTLEVNSKCGKLFHLLRGEKNWIQIYEKTEKLSFSRRETTF